MATDEREWTLKAVGWYDDSDDRYSFRQDWSVSAPDPTEQECDEKADVDVVPKARAVAAEQRVRELEAGWANYDNSLERTLERAEQAEAKLVTAVEALRRAQSEMLAAGSDLRSVGSHQNAQMAYDAELRIARALSEIEQGDTK